MMRLIESYGAAVQDHWSDIARVIGGRNSKQCRDRLATLWRFPGGPPCRVGKMRGPAGLLTRSFARMIAFAPPAGTCTT